MIVFSFFSVHLCIFYCLLVINTYCPWNTMFKENRDPRGTPPHGFPQRTIYYGFSRVMVAAVDRLPSRGLHLPGTPGPGGPHGPRGAPPAVLPRCLQVKELGAIIYNCSRLAQDLEKTFQTYWVLGLPEAVLPRPWPRDFSSHINRFQPLQDYFDGLPTTAYFSASPPALCPHGRTRDLDALLAVMGSAREFIYASVMEYFPTTRFIHPARYWPVLDTALRAAAVGRGLRVRLLVSCWLNTDPSMFPYLRSLQALSNPAANVSVEVKVFIVPVRNHSNIPFSRVNHSKFMVTEKAAYIGTSNWSEDYFSSTSGVGLVVSQRASSTQPGVTTVQEQLRQLFERDWSSRYAVGLDGQAQGQDCVWQG